MIFGGACEAKPPLDAELAPQEMSFEGAEMVVWDFDSGAFAEADGGSGVAQASFEPQASVSPSPANELLVFRDAVGVDLGC